jgi:polyhydroxybutyrate depolymerase
MWANLNGCSPMRTSHVADGIGDDKTSVDLEDYGTGTSGCAVELYIVHGAGHIWPGSIQYLPPRIIGKTTHAIDATTLIWQFFKAHPKP